MAGLDERFAAACRVKTRNTNTYWVVLSPQRGARLKCVGRDGLNYKAVSQLALLRLLEAVRQALQTNTVNCSTGSSSKALLTLGELWESISEEQVQSSRSKPSLHFTTLNRQRSTPRLPKRVHTPEPGTNPQARPSATRLHIPQELPLACASARTAVPLSLVPGCSTPTPD